MGRYWWVYESLCAKSQHSSTGENLFRLDRRRAVGIWGSVTDWISGFRAALVVVRVGRRPVIVQKVCCSYRRSDRLKLQRRLGEVKAIGEIVCRCIAITQRRQPIGLFNKFENATEIMVCVRDISRSRVGRDDDQRHAEAVYVTATPLCAVRENLGGRNVIIPAAPIIPRDENRGVRPILAVADGVYDEATQDGPEPLLLRA